jgi:hypothetical protein
MSMKGSNPPPPDISNKPAAPPAPPSIDRRARRNKERMDKLRDVYQRVQARDQDPEAAMRDIREAVLVLLEEFTNAVFNGR